MNLSFVTPTNPETGLPVSADGLRKVFISYRHQDDINTGVRDLIVSKVLELTDNCAVWYDDALTAGVDYLDEITEAISECDAVILLLTSTILDSDFIWEHEIAPALRQEKGIIPIDIDFPDEKYPLIEERLGRREILKWNESSTASDGSIKSEFFSFDDSLRRALNTFVLDVNLTQKVKSFFLSEKHMRSELVLTPEDRFLMGYGYLNRIGSENYNFDKGIELLDSVVNMYGGSDDAVSLKRDAAEALSTFFQRHAFVSQEYREKAFRYTLKCAELGDKEHMYLTGYLLYRGKYTDRDTTQAAYWLSKAAEHGFDRAAYLLAVVYASDSFDLYDREKAIELFTALAEKNNSQAMFQLGYIYQHMNEANHLETAAEWYRKAAELGSSYAMCNLGYLYEKGLGTERNEAETARLYEKATKRGLTVTALNLGHLYLTGRIVGQNIQKAVEYYKIAAEAKDKFAQHILGILYCRGIVFDKDLNTAAHYFIAAARQGFDASLVALGKLLAGGVRLSRDLPVSNELREKALEAYRKDSNGDNIYLFYTQYITVDLTLNPPETDTLEGLQELTEIGQSYFAPFYLALRYKNGNGVRKNLKKAFELSCTSASMGNAYAMYDVARCYLTGKGVRKNRAKAFEWLYKAGEHGLTDALSGLGQLYFKKSKKPAEAIKGAECLIQAAILGDVTAPLLLAGTLSRSNIEDCDNELLASLAACSNPGDNKGYIFAHKMLLTMSSSRISPRDAIGRAALLLADCYLNEYYIEKDCSRAGRWCSLAFALGNRDAAYLLASLQEENLIPKVFEYSAAELYKTAADAGHPQALFRLGRLKYEKSTSEEEKCAAVTMIKDAARGGVREAREYLSSIPSELMDKTFSLLDLISRK